MSLWSVDDEAARDWIRSFYENWLGSRRSIREAVRAACRERLRAARAGTERGHPYYWAGLILVGHDR